MTSVEDASKRLGCGEATNPRAAEAERVVFEYPSEFFKDGRKPVLSVKYMDLHLNAIRETILVQIRTKKLDPKLATTYLVKLLFPITAVNNFRWVSFGILLGEPGETIGIDKLVTLRQLATEVGDLDGEISDVDEDDDWMSLHDKWMCLYVVSIYRLIKINNEIHRADMTKKVNHQLRVYGGRCDIDGAYERYFDWTFEKDYRRMIAAIDMFFYRFQIHEWAHLRFGTLESRYRDCAGLTNMQSMISLFGLSGYEDLHEWIFVSHVVDDFRRMIKDGEEVDDPCSYMPYIADFGIARKSPYSCTLNVAFHMWSHLTCALAGSMRSIHAHVIRDIKMHYLRINAMVMACAFRGRFAASVVQDRAKGQTGQVERQDKVGGCDEPGDIEVSGDLPTSLDPRVWSKYLRDNEGMLPEPAKKYCLVRVREIRDAREGTIGRWLQQNITG